MRESNLFSSFPRTWSFVGSDGAKGWLALGVVAFGIAAGWLLWLTTARVSVVETALRARLETSSHVHPVESVASGRVVALPAVLGRRVEAGELLLMLETEHQEHAITEARARRDAWRKKLAASRTALENLRRVASGERELAQRRLAEVEAKRAVELVDFEYASQRADRSEKLFELGLVSEVDLLHHQGDAEKAGARARVHREEARALTAEARRDEEKRAAELTEIERDIGEARGEISSLDARIDLLLHEIEDRHVRAPAAGRIGWITPAQIGAVTEVGDRVAEIVPDDGMRVVAYFPRSSVGRLEVGQRGRLRVDALSWTRYGAVDLAVERLGTEADQGEVRAELSVSGEPSLPLAHGMTGRLEVIVEQLTPARWLLEAIGRAAPQGRPGD
ncbi:MAG: HlyD family efflux transporter periplasmic adaptor subunit [Holophagales bacterium]|nr:HlyD family efflux transporter periplasmic adaptor subunit [Holophagales bacterium]